MDRLETPNKVLKKNWQWQTNKLTAGRKALHPWDLRRSAMDTRAMLQGWIHLSDTLETNKNCCMDHQESQNLELKRERGTGVTIAGCWADAKQNQAGTKKCVDALGHSLGDKFELFQMWCRYYKKEKIHTQVMKRAAKLKVVLPRPGKQQQELNIVVIIH